MPAKKQSARERLLAAAGSLFYSRGIGATGIDAITAEAGVAKMSLYNNFSSKAELVQTYIDARHAEWMDLYRKRLEQAATPQERVLAVFDAYADHADFFCGRGFSGFRGCGMLNAAAELPAADAGRVAVKRHKDEVALLVQTHLLECEGMTGEKAAALTEHLSFLLEGAMALAGLDGNSGKLCRAKKIAAVMLLAL